MTQLSSRTALVTGASRGIGAAIARRLAQDGCAVVVNSARVGADADAVVQDIGAGGGRALALQADVADPAAVARLFAETEAAFGGVDVVVANAGIMTLAPLAEMTDAEAGRQIAINLTGAFNTLREAARRVQRGGRIVALSSSVIGLRLEGYGVYAATKAAVETMTGVLSKELRGREITVNALAPGPTATDLFLSGKSEELVERMARMNPLERLGTPEDIAAAVAFLAGPEGGWINGQVLRANGGMV